MSDAAEKKSQRPFYEPGWYPDLSNEDYHGSFGYGSTTLKTLADKSMSHLLYERSQEQEMTESLLKGQATHTLIMEPEKFESEFAVRPEGITKPSARIMNAVKPSKDSQKKIAEWALWESILGDRLEVTHDQLEECKAMANAVKSHPIMGAWFEAHMGGIAEQSIYSWYKSEDWDDRDDYKTMLKVRPDWIIPGHPVIFDIKTTKDASFSEFMKQAWKLKYHMSAAMYLDRCNKCEKFLKHCGVFAFTRFVWVVVENTPPYAATYYELSEKDLNEGKQLYHKLVRRLDQYNRSEWKGYGDIDKDGLITPEGRVSELPNFYYNVV